MGQVLTVKHVGLVKHERWVESPTFVQLDLLHRPPLLPGSKAVDLRGVVAAVVATEENHLVLPCHHTCKGGESNRKGRTCQDILGSQKGSLNGQDANHIYIYMLPNEVRDRNTIEFPSS